MRAIFGIANFAIARRTAADLDAIIEAVLELTDGLEPRSFRVRAARADKRFPVTSPEVERRVGAAVVLARGWPVNLGSPERRIHVEIVPGAAYVYAERQRGSGRTPGGGERTRRLPAVWRHRLPGRGLADDATRLSGLLRARARLPAHVAGVD